MSQVAKLFTNGRSQAVRLPAMYRFDSKEVYIRQDPESGDIILSRKPDDWIGFLQAIKGTEIPAGFLSVEERQREDTQRDPLDGIEA
jgi:antitoxin VapB